MNSQIANKAIVEGHRPRGLRAILKSWFSNHVRGTSLPIIATLVVLLLGLPDELVEVLRDLPCHSGISERCETATDTCNSVAAATPSHRGFFSPLADQSRDIAADWLSRIWALLF